MHRLRPILLESGIPPAEMSRWSSHCFRRGSGVDVLEEHGISAMVHHGEWADPRSARPYASADEQRAVGLAAASLVVDASSDDE